MTRKIITGVVAAILLVTIAVLAAEKAMERKYADKYGLKACEQLSRHERLLDQLVEAYKANDKEKMGKIINKMQERREKMQELAKFNRWHQLAHRRMMGQDPQMAGCGRGFQREWTPGPGAENMGQQGWNMPRRERQTNVPPPEWGW